MQSYLKLSLELTEDIIIFVVYKLRTVFKINRAELLRILSFLFPRN